MKKRTKILIIVAMVVLLGVTGYLNIMLNQSMTQQQITTTTSNYFSAFRTDREATRDRELLYYDAIINGENTSPEAKQNAENAKMALMAKMESELTIEGLIKSRGFEDAVITISDNSINVMVKCSSLDEPQVTKILNIVQTELKKTDIEGIKVIKVS